MTDLERVLQRLARLLRGEEQAPSERDVDQQSIVATSSNPGDDLRRDAAPDPSESGAAQA